MRLSNDPGYLAIREAVRPDLAELAREVAARGGPSSWPVAVPFGDESLLLSRLAQELVAELPGREGQERPEWRELSVLALGLQAKILRALCLLATASASDAQRDAAIGLANDAIRGTQLAFALHGEVEALTRAGCLPEAHDLAETRRSLLERVAAARRIAAPQVRAAVSALAAEASAVPPLEDFDLEVALATKRPVAPVPPPRRELTRPRPPVAPPAPVKRRPPWHLPVTVALLVVLAILVAVQLRALRSQAETISPIDLSSVPGILQSIHRPPKVLVVIDQDSWDRMPDEARRAAIETIGRVAEARGYDLAELRSPVAQGLAWWRRGEGVSLPP